MWDSSFTPGEWETLGVMVYILGYVLAYTIWRRWNKGWTAPGSGTRYGWGHVIGNFVGGFMSWFIVLIWCIIRLVDWIMDIDFRAPKVPKWL